MKNINLKYAIMFLAGILFTTFTVFAATISVNTNFDTAVQYLQQIVATDSSGNTGVVLDGANKTVRSDEICETDGIDCKNIVDLVDSESDPIFMANSGNYLISENDPIFAASPANGISSSDITNWNNNTDTNAGTICPNNTFLNGDGTCDSVVTSESDPIFAASPANGISSSDITNWNNNVNTDTQDLSYNALTNVISLTDGGSIDISEVDTDTYITTQTCPAGEYLSSVGKTTKVCSTPSGGGSSLWSTGGTLNSIYYDGKVGIQNNTPSAVLDVVGKAAGTLLNVNYGSDILNIYSNGTTHNIGINGIINMTGTINTNQLNISPVGFASTSAILTVDGDVSVTGDIVTTANIEAGNLLIPDIKTLNSNSCSTIGAIIYNTRDNELCFCNGTNYKLISDPSTSCSDGSVPI